MALQIVEPRPSLGAEVHFSYYVKRKDGKPSRVGLANVLDISETGLCMEISPLDSDLFAESFGELPVHNREIGLQIFCRSHPSNVFVEGSVRWFKQKKEFGGDVSPGLGIRAGVVFSISDPEQKREIMDLLGRLKGATVHCTVCQTIVSAAGAFCYECGARLMRRRSALRNAIRDALAPEGDQLVFD